MKTSTTTLSASLAWMEKKNVIGNKEQASDDDDIDDDDPNIINIANIGSGKFSG